MQNRSLFSRNLEIMARTAGDVSWAPPEEILDRWQAGIHAAAQEDAEIDILDVIGEDFWTGGGVTAVKVRDQLKSIGADDVSVIINSPGGDVFEGLAIYNILRQHKGAVTVKIVGLAASAASVIAMAGNRIEIAKSGLMMLHNAWALSIGNRHDMRATADIMEEIDGQLAGIYADRAEVKESKALGWMDGAKPADDGTWLSGTDAVAEGLADDLLPDDAIAEDAPAAKQKSAARKLDRVMAKAGLSRSEGRKLIQEIKGGTPGAAATITPGAGGIITPRADEIEAAAIDRLRAAMKV